MFSIQVNVQAAHFGARMLKRRPPGGWGMPNRREIWLFSGVNGNEIGWIFHGGILTIFQSCLAWPPSLVVFLLSTDHQYRRNYLRPGLYSGRQIASEKWLDVSRFFSFHCFDSSKTLPNSKTNPNFLETVKTADGGNTRNGDTTGQHRNSHEKCVGQNEWNVVKLKWSYFISFIVFSYHWIFSSKKSICQKFDMQSNLSDIR